MFSSFTSETYRVVNDVYKKDTEETYSYILTYLYSKTTRIYKAIEAINDNAKKELKKGRFGISRRLLLMILENFEFIFYTFDNAILKLLTSCLDLLDEKTFCDYERVFSAYFSTVVDKPYKNEKYYKDLFAKLCTRVFPFDQERLIEVFLSLREFFVVDLDEKFRHFNRYLHTRGRDRERLVVQMLENANIVNAMPMFSSLIYYGSKNNYDVVRIMLEHSGNRTLVILGCNAVLRDFFAQIPLECRGKEQFETRQFFYREISLIVGWACETMERVPGEESVEDEVGSFMGLLRTYYMAPNNRYVEISAEMPTLLVEYFRLFLSRTSACVYRLVLRNAFHEDFVASPDVATCLRECQKFVLQMLIEDKRTFHDPRLFILLGDIFSLVECFRDAVVALLAQFMDNVFGDDEGFNDAFEARLRMMYFISKSDALRSLLAELVQRRPSARTQQLLDDQKRKHEGDYTAQFDISSDMATYEGYIGANKSKYGRSLKSSINLERVVQNRRSRLKLFKNKPQ